MESPGLTLCMISRNEADCIGDAIRSCLGIIDDIIVVDTGSTDETVAVAEKLGARVFHQPWEDSFSKPRNYGGERVNTPWMFVLDCDERLRTESRDELVEFCRSATAHAGVVNLQVHSGQGVSPLQKVRVGRANMGYRFHYRIHETILPPFQSIATTNITLDHFGYLHKGREEKDQLYARLQQLDLAERPNDNYLLIDTMHSLLTRADVRWKEYLPRAVATLDRTSEKAPNALAEVLLHVILRLGPESLPAGLSKTEADQLAEKWLAKSIPLLAARTGWHLRHRRFAEAKQLTTRALELWNTKSFHPGVPFKADIVVRNLELMGQAADKGLGGA